MFTPSRRRREFNLGAGRRSAAALRVPSAGPVKTLGPFRSAVTARGACLPHGFTLVELLVVITIIGMLMALLFPAISSVRQRMLTSQCSNNLRQIGLAMINHATSKGTLPGYVQPVPRLGATSGKSYVTLPTGSGLTNSVYANTQNVNESLVSWAAILLPRLDHQDIWDRLSDGDASDPVRAIGVFVCPVDNDAKSSPDNAALTYIVNVGAWDWNTGGSYLSGPNMGDTTDNGLFHNLTRGGLKSRLEVHDGAATTLMLSENVHKDSAYSWLGVPYTGVVPFNRDGEQFFGMDWVVNPAPQSGANITFQEPFSKENSPSGFDPSSPRYARPASNHPGGGFNVVFVDGHVTNLQPSIDYEVYQALLTPNGSKCVDPTGWGNNLAPGQAIYQFRARPPLSEKDFE